MNFIILKIMDVSHEKSYECSDTHGIINLYPRKTIRTIKVLTFTGIKLLQQEADIHITTVFNTTIIMNTWKLKK